MFGQPDRRCQPTTCWRCRHPPRTRFAGRACPALALRRLGSLRVVRRRHSQQRRPTAAPVQCQCRVPAATCAADPAGRPSAVRQCAGCHQRSLAPARLLHRPQHLPQDCSPHFLEPSNRRKKRRAKSKARRKKGNLDSAQPPRDPTFNPSHTHIATLQLPTVAPCSTPTPLRQYVSRSKWPIMYLLRGCIWGISPVMVCSYASLKGVRAF
jgi:hypothetical protein